MGLQSIQLKNIMITKVNEFWVPENDIHIEDWKSGKPFTQNKCLIQFKEWCRTQDKKFKTVIDVGAWCGTWAVEMQQFCDRLQAFEPNALNFKCLEQNISKYNNINCYQFALGDKETMLSITEDQFTQAIRIDEKEGKIPVKTIDSFGWTDVDLIKIDVEGYEMKVLEGANETLENVKFLMIELNNNTKKYGSSNGKIEEHLKELGFYEIINIWPDKVYCR